jgi:hypothetical protein
LLLHHYHRKKQFNDIYRQRITQKRKATFLIAYNMNMSYSIPTTDGLCESRYYRHHHPPKKGSSASKPAKKVVKAASKKAKAKPKKVTKAAPPTPLHPTEERV